MLPAALLLGAPVPARSQSSLIVQVLDGSTGSPVAGAQLRLDTDATTAGNRRLTLTGEDGRAHVDVAPGVWRVRVSAYGYLDLERGIRLPRDQPLRLNLAPRPLIMDEMIVRGLRDGESVRAPAFVESLTPDRVATPGADVAQLLESATGVEVRRYGGLGSSSTVSIRGSTSEQVLVYLDGIPLQRASGGGVDLGSLPLAGIESVDVYRGAVPARFGGNSLGGVVHLRTRAAGGRARWRLESAAGSFGTRQVSLSASGPWRGVDWMGLADVTHSDNNFRFFDDNGTEYNTADDRWTRRRNSDYTSGRIILKAGRSFGNHRLQLHDVHDVSHKGLPGIGNFQSLETRYDTWRNLFEALLFGPAGARSGYRLRLYRSQERGTFMDLAGEVGAARDHDRTTTRALGARGEWSAHGGAGRLLTLFADARRERFTGRDLLRDEAPRADARRAAVTVGTEVEWPVGRGLSLHAGAQWDGIDDELYDDGNFIPAAPLTPSENRAGLWGGRFGATLALGGGWTVKGHTGHYSRAPSFFELFGDRGAIIGNTDLIPESGANRDVGLHYRGEGPVSSVEAVLYDHRVDDLIRFVQNSQFVSRAHNIGRARMRGMETRVDGSLATPLGPALSARASYVYQQAENRSPFSFEKGNDLPNAPRHRAQLRLGLRAARWAAHWEARRESRHFLDRANLRTVPRRTIQSLQGRLQRGAVSLSVEVRNLTDNGVADLWGYPLPGRAYHFSLSFHAPRDTSPMAPDTDGVR